MESIISNRRSTVISPCFGKDSMFHVIISRFESVPILKEGPEESIILFLAQEKIMIKRQRIIIFLYITKIIDIERCKPRENDNFFVNYYVSLRINKR
tara:strand:- start:260 stop:550 length:291 start_codon:yes stop_codon:yes gene_type:complete